MQIEDGECYKDSAGNKIGPMESYGEAGRFREKKYDRRFWTSNGFANPVAQFDLVAIWQDGPVVTETVTKTRIVPGVYGRVNVHLGRDNPNNMYVSFTNQAGNTHSGQLLTADELDAAAAVLSALAKGLRDV